MLKSVNEIGKHLDREVTWCEHDFTTVTNFMPVISVTTLNTKSLLFKVKHTGQNIIFIVHLRYKFLLSLNEFSRKVFGGDGEMALRLGVHTALVGTQVHPEHPLLLER